MSRHSPTPAFWSALLFSSLLFLQGCSLLPLQDDHARADTAAQDAFTLVVLAPPAIRPTLERHLDLQRFRTQPDLQPRELTRLLSAADDDARQLLATLGYFSPTLTVDLAPAAPGSTATPTITLRVEPGPQTQVVEAEVEFAGAPPSDAPTRRQHARIRNGWLLPPGQPFTQTGWDNAKNQGLRQLQTRRHPTARIADSRADIDADQQQARLAVTYDPGPLVHFGPLRVEGSQRYDPDGARRLARLPTGAEYDEAQLLDAQLRLASSGYYDAVFLTLDTEGTDPLAAPVVAQVREAPLQKLVSGVGLSTDSGARLSLDHTHNRLPGIGWRALSKLALDRNTKRLGTDWMALPNEGGWRWFSGAQLQRETTGDYEVNSTRLRAGRSQSTDHIDRNYALQFDTARSQGVNAPPSSAALSAQFGWTGRYFNSPTAPTRGYGVAWELGVGTTLRPQRDPFVRLLARWLHYQPLGRVEAAQGPARQSRLAWRAEAGAVLARGGAQLPVTQLFLTGGDTTVRGYGYRAIGARTDNGQLFGGRYLAVGSAEWQRPIVWKGEMTDWESTLFVDAGAVADQPGDLHARVGVGAGLRWRSPVGPVQADLAWGVQAKELRLHLRLGFSF
ncbi:BamA/TamA family outer membrane protein [Diaphorobacter sp.]|uniref:autotransporter assembly complex protein TamA n=1 Tax=Diaphorobacter sp. TaxID=1934310 RepID=UPI0025861893|nr:BamA/TamA family outer membrane protein [Diaphorobacter sp.]